MTLAIDTQNLHPTTEMSLEALQWLDERGAFENILDVGCGAGILSIVSAHIWNAKILAVDISSNAVADAKKAIETYRLSDVITVERSDGFSNPSITKRAPYDLMLCNLLADIVVKIAPEVQKNLTKGGYAILSGNLVWMAENVEKAYLDLGFEIVHKIKNSPWYCYIVRNM